MNRRVLAIGLAVALPLIVILVVSLGRNPHAVKSPLIGRPAPPFALRNVITGEQVSMNSLRGKPVVLNFWATWCVPCHQEHSVLVAAAQAFAPDVQFVGLVFNDEEGRIRQFLDERGSAYPTLLDDTGKAAISYGVYGVPETFFIDPSGYIVEKFEGPLTPQAIRENLSKTGYVLR